MRRIKGGTRLARESPCLPDMAWLELRAARGVGGRACEQRCLELLEAPEDRAVQHLCHRRCPGDKPTLPHCQDGVEGGGGGWRVCPGGKGPVCSAHPRPQAFSSRGSAWILGSELGNSNENR